MEINKDLLVCGICKASFSLHSFTKFIEHKMLHLDTNKRIECCLCMKVFPKRISLQNHLERVHAIPKRGEASVGHKDTSVASSSARCNPCLPSEEDEDILSHGNKLEDSHVLTITTHQIDNTASSEFSLLESGQGVCNNIIETDNESFENSNSSIDVLSIEESLNGIPVNPLFHFDHGYCNGNSMPGLINEKNEHDSNFFESSSESPIDYGKNPNAMNMKQNCESKEASDTKHSNSRNVENLNHTLTVKDNTEGFVNDDDERNENEKEEMQLKNESTPRVESTVDFHFLLGTTSIKGNSMMYERVEFRCMHCSFSSAWRPSLVKHMKNAHCDVIAFHEILNIQNVPETEGELGKKYKIMKLSDHSKMMNTNRASKSKSRKRSLEFQDVPGEYTCPICDKVFSRIRYIRRHQMTHRTQRTYLCNTCGKSFKTKATLVTHSRSHDIKVYHCPQCDFVSNLTGAIHRHRQLHPNGSVICDICGTAYIDKSTLKKHRRVHDLSRPFACSNPLCTWRFKSENLMKAHAKAHSVEGKFQCSSCGYRFRHKHHLQRHVAKIHPDSIIENPTSLSAVPESAPASKTTPESNVTALSSTLSIMKQDIGFNFTNSSACTNSSNNVLRSVLDSALTVPLQNQTLSSSCEQINVPESAGCKTERNMIQVLVNGGQEIVINLQAENSLELSSGDGGMANLDYNNTDIIQQMNLGQIYIVKDSQSN